MIGSADQMVSPRVRLAWQDVVPGAGMGLPDYYDGGRPVWGTPYRYPGVARFSHLPFPTLSQGRVYAQAPGQIRCVSLEDGKVLWSAREADLAPQRRPALHHDLWGTPESGLGASRSPIHARILHPPPPHRGRAPENPRTAESIEADRRTDGQVRRLA